MAGKFHVKRHMREHRHERVKEGLRRVAMRSDGCKGMYVKMINQKKVNRVTDSAAGHTFGKGVWCGMVWQGL